MAIYPGRPTASPDYDPTGRDTSTNWTDSPYRIPSYVPLGPVAPPTGGGGPNRGGGAPRYDYRTSPAYQEFLAYYNRERQSAGGRLTEAKRRRLIQLGSKDVARRILGESDPTLAGISSDAASTSDLGRLMKSYQDMLQQVEAETSMMNTFWGTGRAQGYEDAAYGRQMTEFDLISQAEQDLQSFQDNYSQYLRGLEGEKRGVEQEAWMNTMWANLLTGGGLPGTPGGAPGGPPSAAGRSPNGLAQQTHNPGARGQNARYSTAGLMRLDPPQGSYIWTDGVYRYDANGLSDRPDEWVEGLPGADEMGP